MVMIPCFNNSVLAAPGDSCTNAIQVATGSSCNPSSYNTNDTAVWFSFVASDSNIQVVGLSATMGTTNPHVHRLTLYSGTCNSLIIIEDEYMPDIAGASELELDASHLIPGNTYYVRASRTPASTSMSGCNANLSGVCNSAMTWTFSICLRSLNFIVPMDDTIEPPALSRAYYQCKGQITDTNKKPQFNIKAYTNYTSPALYLTDNSVSFVQARGDTGKNAIDTTSRVDMLLTGKTLLPAQRLFKTEKTKDYLNYFLGFVPEGVTNVKGYYRTVWKSVYPKIDMQFFSNNAGTKFYFVCDTVGSDPNQIQITFKGASSINITPAGGLSIVTVLGTISFNPANAYCINPAGHPVPMPWQGKFKSVNANTVAFDIRNHPANMPLVLEVDQGHRVNSTGNLNWSTYIGGSNNMGDNYQDVYANNTYAYVAGNSFSADFPVTPGVVQGTNKAKCNAVIGKFSQSTSTPQWSTYYGGSISTDFDAANSVQADQNGNVYVTGSTASPDFPIVTPTGAYTQSFNQGMSLNDDAFIVVLNPTGTSVLWSTYFGGSQGEIAYHLTLDGIFMGNCQNLYIVGSQAAYQVISTIPLKAQAGAYNSSSGIAWIAKFNIGPSAKFGQWLWSTDIGGNNGSQATNDALFGCTVDVNNDLFVTGQVIEPGYPTTDGSVHQGCCGNADVVVTKFDASNNAIDWSTDYGGDGDDIGNSIICDQNGNVYVTGSTDSPFLNPTAKIPLVNPGKPGDYYQSTNNGGFGNLINNAFIAEYNNSGTLLWSTYYGGTDDIQAHGVTFDDGYNGLYITGQISGGTLPLPSPNAPHAFLQPSYGGGNHDGFIAAFDQNDGYKWGTYFGGQGDDIIRAASVDYYGENLYIVGSTKTQTGSGFPLNNAFQNVNNSPVGGNAFIADFNTQEVGLGINGIDILDSIQFTVFPNPTSSEVTVQMELSDKQDVEFVLYNSIGQVVYDKPLNAQQGLISQKIDVSLLAQGLYLLKVNSGANSYCTKKIVKLQ